ncbi:hypothetical protein Naga_100318g6 [Nannochloropsis gaditana]|uniref:Uncharacterized protein n=1 Tax=Nannochloropsis gaditana TaxID=72520 RepID=W7U500_9STRA|nr:hypothetical protein Naga_100318g6 [Nannochloropsis gaditana]
MGSRCWPGKAGETRARTRKGLFPAPARPASLRESSTRTGIVKQYGCPASSWSKIITISRHISTHFCSLEEDDPLGGKGIEEGDAWVPTSGSFSATSFCLTAGFPPKTVPGHQDGIVLALSETVQKLSQQKRPFAFFLAGITSCISGPCLPTSAGIRITTARSCKAGATNYSHHEDWGLEDGAACESSSSDSCINICRERWTEEIIPRRARKRSHLMRTTRILAENKVLSTFEEVADRDESIAHQAKRIRVRLLEG